MVDTLLNKIKLKKLKFIQNLKDTGFFNNDLKDIKKFLKIVLL